jgi:hypothetical protein
MMHATNYSMRFYRNRRRVLFASIPQQGSYIALVVDLDGLLCRGRVIAGRRRLQYQTVNGSKDEELSDKRRHVANRAMRIKKVVTRREAAFITWLWALAHSKKQS